MPSTGFERNDAIYLTARTNNPPYLAHALDIVTSSAPQPAPITMHRTFSGHGRRLMRIVLFVPLAFMLAACGRERAPELSEVQLRVVDAVHEVDSLRSARAESIRENERVDFETFARACQPVGLRAREIAQLNGWQFRQISVRNRNPANVPDSSAYVVYRQFQENPSLDSLWQENEEGLRYFHRITVEEACLHCHGEAERRPRFVFERYPDDRAYGFDVGDLRGLYSVTVPDSVLGSEDGGEQPAAGS